MAMLWLEEVCVQVWIHTLEKTTPSWQEAQRSNKEHVITPTQTFKEMVISSYDKHNQK